MFDISQQKYCIGTFNCGFIYTDNRGFFQLYYYHDFIDFISKTDDNVDDEILHYEYIFISLLYYY